MDAGPGMAHRAAAPPSTFRSPLRASSRARGAVTKRASGATVSRREGQLCEGKVANLAFDSNTYDFHLSPKEYINPPYGVVKKAF
jgi:hypothetical protein